VLLVATAINITAVFVVWLVLSPAARRFQSNEVAGEPKILAEVA
jgi:hypothetical protein